MTDDESERVRIARARQAYEDGKVKGRRDKRDEVRTLLDDRIEQHQERLDERGGPGHGQPEKLAGKIEALEELREQIGEVDGQ